MTKETAPLSVYTLTKPALTTSNGPFDETSIHHGAGLESIDPQSPQQHLLVSDTLDIEMAAHVNLKEFGLCQKTQFGLSKLWRAHLESQWTSLEFGEIEVYHHSTEAQS